MTSPVAVENGGWLAIVGRRVALPDGLSDHGFARHVTQELMGQRGEQVDKILAASGSASRVDAWVRLFASAESAEVFEFFAFRPLDVIEVFAEKLEVKRRWSTLVEIYEACYALAADDGSGTALAGGLPHAARLAAAHLARTRWRLLSVPFTGSGRPSDKDLRRVNDDTGRLVALARQARDDMLAVLATIDDHPQLAGRIGDVEADARDIVAVPVTQTRLGLDQLGKKSGAEDRDDPPGREAARFAVTRLLLPRFAWGTVTATVRRSACRAALRFSAAALAAVLVTAVLALLASILSWSWAYTAAASTAGGVYLLVAFATIADARVAWPWLLRQPASAAVGLLALAAFGPTWWYTGGASGHTVPAVLAAIGLAVAAVAYLYIEAAQHGLRGRRLYGRPVLVGLFGLIHGLLVSLIGLRFLLPVFAAAPAGGPSLSCWYAVRSCHGQALATPLLIALAAAWSFAAGVFLQIVWDDQPVTAPLTHVRWRRGG
ncbi:MAG: hypothetical protein ACRDRJ_10990 [Streptosporangiaceae bacterium]